VISGGASARDRGYLARCAAALLLTGCGAGLPLLHPAQTLPPGEVRAAAGMSASVAAGGLSDALRSATNEAAASAGGTGSGGADETYARGALVAASVTPGLAPLVGARVGLGSQFEAGLAYTGRSVRADARRAFGLSQHWALSVGAGGTAVLYGRQAGDVLPNVDLGQLHGWGADLPVLVGYESDGGLYMVWAGARGGWEHVDIGQVTSVPSGSAMPASVSLSATRFWAGGLLGVAAGFRHVHVALEIDIAYASVAGDYLGVHASVAGLALTPAGCLWWDF
jgi:hypothetical protein